MWSFKEGYSWCWGWICSFFGGMCQPSLKWWNMFTRKWIEWRGGGFLGHFRPCEKDEALRSNFGSCLFLHFPMAFASWHFCFGFTWIHWLPDWYIYLNGSSFSSFGRKCFENGTVIIQLDPLRIMIWRNGAASFILN